MKKKNNIIKIDLKFISIWLFTVYFSTLYTPINLTNYLLIVLIISIVILIFSHNKNRAIITNIEKLWVMFFLMIIVSSIINLSKLNFVNIIVYFCLVLFLIFANIEPSKYKIILETIKIHAIIYAFGVILQYYFPEIYIQMILPLFPSGQQFVILDMMSKYSYSGFTNQTAHTAGYIVNGIGVICMSQKIQNNKHKVINLFFLLLFIFAVFLTGKRGPTIFLLLSLLISYLASSKKQNRLKFYLILFVISILVVIFVSNSLYIIELDKETALGRMVIKYLTTIEGLLSGKDVSSGRFVLYRQSWKLFLDKPVFGIGWGQFSEQSLGLINDYYKSHPHNIYLQVLCEMGLIGFTFFLIPLIYTYRKTFLILRLMNKNNNMQIYNLGIRFSFFIQTFFILYGVTGNVLTDYNFIAIYILACSISISTNIKLRRMPQ